MKEKPVISVIMSVYNGEEYLAEAIESVRRQTFENWELIVINDCSSDGTGAILGKYAALDSRIRVYTNEVNIRLAASLNKAIELAEGKYTARMDADDICMPDRLEKQYEFMESNPGIKLSSCRFLTLKDGTAASGGGGGRCDSESVRALLLVTNPILHPGIIADSEIMKKLKYDTTLTCTEDLELWIRAVSNGYRIMIQDEYLMLYRLHDKQITETTHARQCVEVAGIQKKYYSEFLEPMNEEQEKFYISGIYFRDKTDMAGFCDFFRRIKGVNKKRGAFDKNALNYAMLEILAEYKRCGISGAALMRGLLCFEPCFLIREIRARKRRAREDGMRCIAAAEKIGLRHTGGAVEFPVFTGAGR